MNEDVAINIAVTCVMSSALDFETKQQVISVLRTMENESNETK